MGNISPLSPIPVAYTVLPTDVTTYYPQAVLRDTATGRVLQTLNLSQDASYSYRYYGQFSAVSDPSGLGRSVDITIIVYTDSGHTTVSQNYAAAQFNYVVLQPWLPTLGAGGGGSIDYAKLRAEVATVVTEMMEGKSPKWAANLANKTGIKKLTSSVQSSLIESVQSIVSDALERHAAESGAMAKQLSTAHAKSVKEIQDKLAALEERVGIAENLDGESRVRTQTHLQGVIDNARNNLSEVMMRHQSELREARAEHLRVIHTLTQETLARMEKMVQENLDKREIRLSLGSAKGETGAQSLDFVKDLL